MVGSSAPVSPTIIVPMRATDKPTTLIFDMGGVLVHLDWDRVCDPLARLSDQSADVVLKEVVNGPIVKYAMMGLIGPQQFHETLCQRLSISLGYDEFAEIWVRLLSANEEIVPLIDSLKTQYRLVLASNTDRIHFAFCSKHFNVLQRFSTFFLSYEMGLLKPDPAFFHDVLAGLGTAPEECVFVDDRLENVEAARSVGITSLPNPT